MLFQTRLLMTSVMLLGVAACTTQPLTHTAGSPFITDTQAAPIAFQSLRLEGKQSKGKSAGSVGNLFISDMWIMPC